MVVFFIILAIILLYLSVELILCNNAVKKAYRRLETYNAQSIELSNGKMTYVDSGKGEVLFVVHGICGGYDTIDMMKDKQNDYRIIVPSRFGYLGSEMPSDTSPSNQVNAFIELLDKLNIDKVYFFTLWHQLILNTLFKISFFCYIEVQHPRKNTFNYYPYRKT